MSKPRVTKPGTLRRVTKPHNLVVNEDKVKFLISLLADGLAFGLGKRASGQMCVEACVAYAFDEAHHDRPTCVNRMLSTIKICLNDRSWGSPISRANGLRQVAIAQLGTNTPKFDVVHFATKFVELASQTVFECIERRWECLPYATDSSDGRFRDKTRKDAKVQANMNMLEAYKSLVSALTVKPKDNKKFITTARQQMATTACEHAVYAINVAIESAFISRATADVARTQVANSMARILEEMGTEGSKYLHLVRTLPSFVEKPPVNDTNKRPPPATA